MLSTKKPSSTWQFGEIGVLINFIYELRTPNEGITQSYLKNWADVADKICFDRNLNIWD